MHPVYWLNHQINQFTANFHENDGSLTLIDQFSTNFDFKKALKIDFSHDKMNQIPVIGKYIDYTSISYDTQMTFDLV